MKNIVKPGSNGLILFMSGVLGVYPLSQVHAVRAEKAITVLAAQSKLTNSDDRAVGLSGNVPNRPTEDPNLRKCMCQLWRTSGYGFRQTEAAMDIIRAKDSSLSCRFWPFAHLHQRTEAPGGNWPSEDVVAIAHTHPRKATVQYPSDPDDYLRTLDDYVICNAGIFAAEKGCTRQKNKKACTQKVAGADWYKDWCE